MINLALIFILLLPLAFQLIVGYKASKGHLSSKFWQVSLVSLCGQVLSAVCNLFLIREMITRSGSRHGLTYVGMFILELMAGSILLITILIQGYLQYRRNKFSNK